MASLRATLTAGGLLAVGVLACGPGSATIPPDGQRVRVEIVGDTVQIEPATVRAGDVYVVLMTPGVSVGFARSKPTADAPEGPMTDEDLRRLAGGRTEGMSISGFDDSGCSDERRSEDTGRTRVPGGCGNVFKEVLTPGKYALFIGDADALRPIPIALLEVQP